MIRRYGMLNPTSIIPSLICTGNQISLTTWTRSRCRALQSIPSWRACIRNQQAMLSDFQPREHLHSATIHNHCHCLILGRMVRSPLFFPNTWLHLRIHAVSLNPDRTHGFDFSSHILYSYIIQFADRTPPPTSSSLLPAGK